MDPLSLVRDFNVGKKVDKIRNVGDNVDFDGMYMFAKNSFTAFRGARDYCTLEVVLYVLKTRALAQPDYLKQAAAAKLDTLSFIERKKLLDILDGKVSLQLDAAPSVPGQKAADLAEGQDSEPAAKRAKLDGPAAAQLEQRFTRQLRDRNTMLLAPQKDFKLVFDIASRAHLHLSTLFKQKEQQQQQAAKAKAAEADRQKHGKPAQAPPKPSVPVGAKPSGRFDRDTTMDALKAFGGNAAAAGINNMIAMYGSHTQPATNGGQGEGPTNGTMPPPPPASTSAPPPPSTSKSKEQQQQQQRHSSHKHASSSQPQPSSRGGSSRHAPQAAPVAAPVDPLQGKMPIIIVPSGMTAMINMHNARAFLEDGRFEPSSVIAATGKPKESSVVIQRSMGKQPGKSVPYTITDKPPDKKDTAAWGRVVAVIVQGAKWQFKDWPYKGVEKGDMLETFQKVAGFYVHFSDEKVADVVSNWNVKRLGLAREKRHMDAPVVLDLYRHIDQFLASRRSPLAY